MTWSGGSAWDLRSGRRSPPGDLGEGLADAEPQGRAPDPEDDHHGLDVGATGVGAGLLVDGDRVDLGEPEPLGAPVASRVRDGLVRPVGSGSSWFGTICFRGSADRGGNLLGV